MRLLSKNFDPLDSNFDQSSFDAYHELQESDPVYWWEDGRGWIVTRYDDCLEVLRNAAAFGSDVRDWEEFSETSEVSELSFFRLKNYGLTASNAAEHARLRELIRKPFGPQTIRAQSELIETIATSLVSEFRSRGEADLVAEFARPFAYHVIARILGIPIHEDSADDFAELTHRGMQVMNPNLPAAARMGYIEAAEEWVACARSILDQKRREPQADLLSALVRDEHDPDTALSLLLSLVVGGTETVSNTLPLGLNELLQHPDQFKRFQEEPSSRSRAVSEILRHQASTKFLIRYAKQDVVLRQRLIIEGQIVYVAMGAAHRDPGVFREPDRFDISREPQGDQAFFGAGSRFCLGSHLARLELEIGLSTLMSQLSHLSRPSAVLEFEPNSLVRGLQHLPICFDPA